ncbi:aminoglycoside phosphotransferase (APT) family kinase protein [Streptomyces afghaniensis]|nr:aminoglycoside phosphotransferase (APT) family kinase protein [Streptomyces afghaniensis]
MPHTSREFSPGSPREPGVNSVFPGGWDCEARLVDGRWVERRPRRPGVERQLRTETRLLPWLAPHLPLAVPVPHVVSDNPLTVRHVLVRGEPLEEPDAAQGRALGLFLRALHRADTDAAVRRGVPPAREVLRERATLADDFRARVLPLLPPDRHEPASGLLKAVGALPAEALVHGDLGPEHLLAQDGSLTGVIDFGDAHIGDPAIDLAWALNGPSPAFADACAAAYGARPALRRRSRIWHRLGPWHEVTYGLDTGDQDAVRSGLDGVLGRLLGIDGP